MCARSDEDFHQLREFNCKPRSTADSQPSGVSFLWQDSRWDDLAFVCDQLTP